MAYIREGKAWRSIDEAGDRDRAFQGATRRRQIETTGEGAGVGAHTEDRGPPTRSVGIRKRVGAPGKRGPYIVD